MTCEHCHANQLRAEAEAEAYRLLDKEHRKARSAIAQLKAMLADKHRQAPNAPQVLDVIEHWASELGHLRAKAVTDDKRADAVRKALGWGYTVAELKQAIDGLARYPYVWPNRGRMPYGLKGQRQDHLGVVLSDTSSVDRFIGYSLEAQPDERLVLVPARVVDRMHEQVTAAREAAWRYRGLAGSQDELVRDLAGRVDVLEGSLGRWSGQVPLDRGLRVVRGGAA